MELTKTFRFEASHVLPKHPGKCSRLHGHSWVLHVSVSGPINIDTGFVMDFADISAVVKPLIKRLDHRHLGTWEEGTWFAAARERWGVPGLPFDLYVPGLPFDLYPTSENLLVWIAGQLDGLDLLELRQPGLEPEIHPEWKPGMVIPMDEPMGVVRRHSWWSTLSIEETCTSRATLTREEYDGATEKR
jgi:6-pyruvoyltetrahydropterin/6-carboxytetrahydropterin synthase